MPRQRNAAVWQHFDFISETKVECRICHRKLSTPQGSRSTMSRHLFTRHDINTFRSNNKTVMLLQKQKRFGEDDLEELRKKFQVYLQNQTNNHDSDDDTDLDQHDDEYKYSPDSGREQEMEETHENEMGNRKYVHVTEKTEPTLSNRSSTRSKIKSWPSKDQMNNEDNKSGSLKQNHIKMSLSDSDPLLDTDLMGGATTNLLHSNNIPSSNQEFERHHQPSELLAHLQAEKLKAEIRYFNEMSDLARSKRIFIELSSQKIRNEL